ncbi:unnamed protein product, partial [Rotaria magnacalcarata]
MVHFFRGRRFETFDQVEAACREFFEFKKPHWYRDQIQQLAERWRKVIENDGLYFEEYLLWVLNKLMRKKEFCASGRELYAQH